MHLYYQNVRGLGGKSKSFYLSTSACNYDVILLTETWLNMSHRSEEYFDKHYMVNRCDRNLDNSNFTRGGGVLIAISSNLYCERIFDH